MSASPSRRLEKAIRVPSGDQAGSKSSLGSVVSAFAFARVAARMSTVVLMAGSSLAMGCSALLWPLAGNLPAALRNVAKELIAERGLERFTLREVARRIGVTHVAAYRHYVDRHALLAAVAENGFHQLRRRLEGARKKTPAALAPRLRAILAAYLHFCWDEPALTAVMFAAAT